MTLVSRQLRAGFKKMRRALCWYKIDSTRRVDVIRYNCIKLSTSLSQWLMFTTSRGSRTLGVGILYIDLDIMIIRSTVGLTPCDLDDSPGIDPLIHLS